MYSAGAPGEVVAPGVAGRLSRDALAALTLPTEASAYLCGPPRFMTDIGAALLDLGLAPERIHTEIFEARAAINPGVVDAAVRAPHPPPTPGDGPLVTFSRSRLSVAFDTGQRSLLEMAELCDVPTRFSCRTGVCRTCSTALLAGRVSYDPEPLEPPDVGEALLCCSRPDEDVVLDM
jgi:ferredoxin